MQYRTAIELLLYTGMRRSELCGLEWKDINFETGVIQIRRTSQYIPGRGVITDETKTTAQAELSGHQLPSFPFFGLIGRGIAGKD